MTFTFNFFLTPELELQGDFVLRFSLEFLLNFIEKNKEKRKVTCQNPPNSRKQRSTWRRQWHPTPVLLPGKIPWMEEPGRLQSMQLLGVGYD